MRLKIKCNFKEYIEWCLTFLVIFFSGSAYAASNNNFYIFLKYAVTLSIILIWFIKCKGILRYKTKDRELAIWIPIVWCCILFFNCVFHSEPLINLIIRMMHVILAYAIVSIVSWEKFIENYTRIIIIIATISLACYFVFANMSIYDLIMPKLLGYTLEGELYTKYQGFLLYFKTTDLRNFGAFWEPGIFATHILVALLLFPYAKVNKNKKLLYVILIITLITTASGAGYVLSLMVVAFNIVSKLELGNTKDLAKGFVAIGIIGILIFVYMNLDSVISALPLEDNIIFNKILNISDSERAQSININWKAFQEKPLLGYGYNGLIESDWYSYGSSKKIVIDTATSFRLLAVHGISGAFFTVILIRGILKNRKINFFGKMIAIVIALLIINKEAHDSFLLAWCLMMYLNGREGRTRERKK